MTKLKKLTVKQQVLMACYDNIVIKMRQHFKVPFQITVLVKTLKKHLEKQYLKEVIKGPGH